MKNLKEKITEFFDFIDNQENQDVVKVEEKFKKIFENEYILRRDSINEAYYQIDIKHPRYHHEIYLSHPPRTRVDRVRTVIRLPIKYI